MFFARWIKPIALLITLLVVSLGLAGCDGITDDLNPSSDDNRPAVEEGSLGTQVGQQSPDFSVLDTLGQPRGLYDELGTSTGVVLYFTMWCTACDLDIDHMRTNVIPNFPEVTFFLVDFVSDTVTASRISQLANGHGDIETLADIDNVLTNLYGDSMGITVVIDSAGNIVRMNETYKDGVKLIETLEAL